MENSIVDEFQNLQVLTTYDFQKMDELVQDLTNALEETKSKNGEGCSYGSLLRRYNKKRRGKKRRSSTNHIWEHGNLSEASESSLDEALKDYMENVVQQSDSDDLLAAAKRLPAFAFASHAISLAESDSVTENFSPLRSHRRRRRCKRMAIDPQPDPELALPNIKQKHKRFPSKGRTLEAKSDNIMDTETLHKGLPIGEVSCVDKLPGKRKRGMDKGEGSFDSTQGEPSSGQSQPSDTSSSISSSESDCGIFDEGRDGDDEHSDFFHEMGPACGVPGIIPWWESDQLTEEAADKMDPNFEKILSGTFDYMTPAGKCSFKSRVNKLLGKREIRAGRRRLKDRRACFSMMRYIQDRQQWVDNAKKYSWCSHSSGASQSGEVKRRRKTPPPSPSVEGYVGGAAEPIPETNIGNKMLQSMGWTPGSGLGPENNKGITIPIMAYIRPKRKGLATTDS